MSGGSIEVRDMVARRGSFSLRVDSLHIEPHEIFAIVGETGAGKTVLLEAIAGAFPLERGSILLDGKDIRCTETSQRRWTSLYYGADRSNNRWCDGKFCYAWRYHTGRAGSTYWICGSSCH